MTDSRGAANRPKWTTSLAGDVGPCAIVGFLTAYPVNVWMVARQLNDNVETEGGGGLMLIIDVT